MAKLTKVALAAVSIGALIASEAMAQYRPGMLGVDTNLRAHQYTPPAPRPIYVPPPAQSIPIPKPNIDYTKPPRETNELKLPPPVQAPAPRFEGGGGAVPTPDGGAAGALVVRDNKNGVTIQGTGRVEPNGAVRDSNITVTGPLPGGEPKTPGGK